MPVRLPIQERSILLVDTDQENCLLAQKQLQNVAIIPHLNLDEIEKRVRDDYRQTILISADIEDVSAVMGVGISLTEVDEAEHIGILSSLNAVPLSVQSTRNIVNGKLLFFSNGKEQEGLVCRIDTDCELCSRIDTTLTFKQQKGRRRSVTVKEDGVCPRCNNREGKNWPAFVRFMRDTLCEYA